MVSREHLSFRKDIKQPICRSDLCGENLLNTTHSTSQNSNNDKGMSCPITFTIVLEPEGDGDSKFAFPIKIAGQAHSKIPFLNSNNHEVRGRFISIIHGRLMGSESEAATLIVAHFDFHSPNDDQRFRSASVEFVFKDPERPGFGPEVCGIAPDGEIDLYPGTSQVTSVYKRSGRVGCPFLGADAAREFRISHELENKGSLIGKYLSSPDSRKPDMAIWSMRENKVKKKRNTSGITGCDTSQTRARPTPGPIIRGQSEGERGR